MISEEEMDKMKNQIFQQIDSTFQEDQKEQAKSQIDSMNNEQFEKFIEQNNLIKNRNTIQNPQAGQQCPFCLINSGQINSYKISENQETIAVLELNPISKAHLLVIPKEHLGNKKISKNVYSFAEKISKNVRSKFKPKGILFSDSNIFNHGIVNVIPIYNNETINSPRYQAKKEDLEEIQKTLTIKTTKKAVVKNPRKKTTTKTKSSKKIVEKKQWLPKRIP